jgi:hypothetical protein
MGKKKNLPLKRQNFTYHYATTPVLRNREYAADMQKVTACVAIETTQHLMVAYEKLK